MNDEKKYREAIEKLREALAPTEDGYKISGLTRDCLENIFPELKESEGEKIRKELIKHIKANYETDYVLFKKFSPDDVIAWLEKQGEQKQTWEPNAAQLIVIKDLIEDKSTSKVNKVILRGMLEEFKQFTNSQSSQFSSGRFLDPDKVIGWLVANIGDYEYYVKLFKKDFEL